LRCYPLDFLYFSAFFASGKSGGERGDRSAARRRFDGARRRGVREATTERKGGATFLIFGRNWEFFVAFSGRGAYINKGENERADGELSNGATKEE